MAHTAEDSQGGLFFDEIGYWTEIKLDIVKEYAAAYSRILANNGFKTAYIDGFAGSGVNLAKSSGRLVPGSPLNALMIHPPFHEYFLVDLDGGKADQLRRILHAEGRRDARVIAGDANRVLIDDVFPHVQYKDYRRALCVLDPYGLHLDWQVIETAGKMRSIEIFLNFPIMDMNRNALWRKPAQVPAQGQERMTAFWGNASWRDAAYTSYRDLFGEEEQVKQGNKEVADAFSQRLKSAACFEYVAEPLPMRNSRGAVVYYLLFASHQPVAKKIVDDIVKKYRGRGA